MHGIDALRPLERDGIDVGQFSDRLTRPSMSLQLLASQVIAYCENDRQQAAMLLSTQLAAPTV
jgi:hypothetical protein